MHGWYLDFDVRSRVVGTISTECPASGEALEWLRPMGRRHRSAINDAPEMGLDTHEVGLGSGSHSVSVSDGRVDPGDLGARGAAENRAS